MKKIFLFFVVFVLLSAPVLAKKNTDDYYIHFGGKKFHLLYSAKNKETGGYLNEYYPVGQTYNLWSELVGIHHFPNAYSPIDQIKVFREYLATLNCPSALTFNDKKNTAIIDFIMISSYKAPVVLEFNIFKYEKSEKCGSVALQYAKRYTATNALQAERIKREIEKHRKKALKRVKNYTIPFVVTEEIDKCKLEPDEEQKTEKVPVTDSVESKPEEGADFKENNSDNIKPDVSEENKTEESVRSVQEEKKSSTETIEESNVSEQKNDDTELENNAVPVEEEKEITETKNNEEETKKQDEAKPVPEVREKQDSAEDLSNSETNAETRNTEENKTAVIQENQDEKQAESKTKKDKKSKKEKSYQLVNDKETYISKPPTKKEIKARLKAEKKRRNAKPYQLVNNKEAYVSRPATKKEMKARVKEAKKRAKEASKKLQESL